MECALCPQQASEYYTAPNGAEVGLCRAHAEEYEADDELHMAESMNSWPVDGWLWTQEHKEPDPPLAAAIMQQAAERGETERLL